MSEQNPDQTKQNAQLSEDETKDVAGGNSIQKRRLEALDARDSSKGIDNIQKARLEALDARDSSKK